MTALTTTIKTLLAQATITAIVKQRIFPVMAPQNTAYPNIVVYQSTDADEVLLAGAAEFPIARVTIECRASGGNPVADADRLGHVVVTALQNLHLYEIDGCKVTFQKEGTDETDASEDQSASGASSVARRIIDFYVRRRKHP